MSVAVLLDTGVEGADSAGGVASVPARVVTIDDE